MGIENNIIGLLWGKSDPSDPLGPSLPDAAAADLPRSEDAPPPDSFIRNETGRDKKIAPRKWQPEVSKRELARRAGEALFESAAVQKEYDVKMELLTQAGAIFSLFGFKEEVYRVRYTMVNAAENAGRGSDAAFHRAITAMGGMDAAAVVSELQAIPKGYEGREILEDFVESHRGMERMTASFAAVAALAGAHIGSMEETESSFLGGIFRVNFDDDKAALIKTIELWRKSLEGGRFASSSEIIEELWRGGSQARRGLSMLAGYADSVPVDLGDVLKKKWGDHVTLGDILMHEGSPEKLAERMEQISANASGEGKNEIAAVAFALHGIPAFASPMGGLISRNFEDRAGSVVVRDVLKGSLEPVNVVTMIGGFALARLTSAAVMAKLISAGAGGISLSGRAAIAAMEIGIEAGAFTFYQRALSSALISRRVDWSVDGFAGDWATLALSFGFLRASSFPLAALRSWMPSVRIFSASPAAAGAKAAVEMNLKGRAAFAVAENLIQTTAFYAGSRVGYGAGLEELPPSFFEQWLTLIEFMLGVKIAGRMTGGWVGRKAMEIKVKPLFDEARLIAGYLTKADPMLKFPLTKQLAFVSAKGAISPRDMLKMRRLIEAKGVESPEMIAAINAFIKKAGIDLVYDGFYLQVPEKGDGGSKPEVKKADVKLNDAAKKRKSAMSMGVLDLSEITRKTPFGTVHDNLTDLVAAKDARGDPDKARLLLVGSGDGRLVQQVYAWFGKAIEVHKSLAAGAGEGDKKFALQPKLYHRILAIDGLRGVKPQHRLAVIGEMVDSMTTGGEILFVLPANGGTVTLEAMANPSAKVRRAVASVGFSLEVTAMPVDGVQMSYVHIRKFVENDASFARLFLEIANRCKVE